MNIKKVAIDSLSPDPANARKHGERNLEAIRDSLRAFGQQKPIVVDNRGVVVAGNGTLEAAKRLGWEEIDAVETDLDPARATAFGIADNRTAELAEWDDEVLKSLVDSLDDELADILALDLSDGSSLEAATNVEEVEIPEDPEPITKPGDLWVMGRHRLLCGDSTSPEDVARLFEGQTASMIHADPPYGMGKEKDGVANDNLYRERLDAFQMEWLKVWTKNTEDNGSLYIWGNAPDLWRLWYTGGLCDLDVGVRNEIVWKKEQAFGMRSALSHSYPVATERCLFLMMGQQLLGNQNTDDYWDGWDSIRLYLVEESKKMNWTAKDIDEHTGVGMAGHYLTRSQWTLITSEKYAKLQEAAGGKAFKKPHQDLKDEHDELKKEWLKIRGHFDNTHDTMCDVWEFGRVYGDDREGHATPKPVEMVARAIKSSSQPSDLVAVPFGGTGPEVVACEQLDRRAVVMELEPKWCDVIVSRWEASTGQKAERQTSR